MDVTTITTETAKIEGRYFTTVTQRQDWDDTPNNGVYAGKSYMITKRFVSPNPPSGNYFGQCVGVSSNPW